MQPSLTIGQPSDVSPSRSGVVVRQKLQIVHLDVESTLAKRWMGRIEISDLKLITSEPWLVWH